MLFADAIEGPLSTKSISFLNLYERSIEKPAKRIRLSIENSETIKG